MAASNEYLKSPHAESDYTPDLVHELNRCRKDPVYFMRNYVFVQHPKRGKVPFDLYDYQVEMVECIHNNRHSIVLASRQVGKCYDEKTSINIQKKPSGLKRLVLRIFYRDEYEKMCGVRQ